MIPGFEWDEEKAQANLTKYGVSFAEATTVFDDPNCLIMDDPKHSFGEPRFLILGYSIVQRLLLVVHCVGVSLCVACIEVQLSALLVPVVQLHQRDETMNEEPKSNAAAEAINDEMLDEYDFSQAIRGNPYRQLNHSSIKIETPKGDRDIQIKTVEVLATVAPDGKVTLQLPPEITPGEHRITLLIQENLTPQTA